LSNAHKPGAGADHGESWYVLQAKDDMGDVVGRLSARFRLHANPVREDVLVYLDTPDWRIHRSGRELSRRGPDGDGGTLELSNGVGTVSREPAARRPEFAWDLPDGSMRAALERVVKVRRLLPQLELATRTVSVDVLDERDKTVLRLALEDASSRDAAARPVPGTVRVLPLRGYDRERDEVVRFLEDELNLAAAVDSGLVRALAAAGRDPAREVPVWRVELEPGQLAGRALRRVLLRLLEVMEASEEGLLADVDTEFLHDFRVAVRRTRSILQQLKKVLPPEEAAHFRDEFAWLGRLTAGVRDLDVFLLEARVRPELQPLVAHLEAARLRDRAHMVEGLRSGRYGELRRGWRAFLEAPRHEADPARAERPIEEVASRRIRKLHRGILERAGVMDADTPPAALHGLRIECKKLRYMIDAFGCLFARGQVKRLLRALKRLQDVLGDYNDLVVQQATLYRFGREMSGASPETLLGLGGIVERLRQRADETRPVILERLREFAAEEDADRMGKLLASSS